MESINNGLSIVLNFYILASIIWLVVYWLVLFKFLKVFKSKHNDVWQEIGSPTLSKKNIALYKFLLGKKIENLSKSIQLWGKLLRYVSYIGLSIIVSMLVSIFLV